MEISRGLEVDTPLGPVPYQTERSQCTMSQIKMVEKRLPASVAFEQGFLNFVFVFAFNL